MIDALEPRRLLSLVLNGTPGDDSFIVSVESDNRVQLNFNGTIEVFNAPADGSVDILGFGGNDDIWLQNTNNLSFYITGHDGDDFYTIGNGQLELDIEDDVHIVEQPEQPGQGGNDRLLINDGLGYGAGTQMIIQEGFILLPVTLARPVLSFNLTPNDQVTIQGSLLDDDYYIEGLNPNMTVNMGAGNDLVQFGGEGRLDYAIPDNVVFDGGTGTDRIALDDSNPDSTNTSILVDRYALLGKIDVANWDEMYIKTGSQPGGEAEPVVFTGVYCPAYAVTIVGSQGPDFVEIAATFDLFSADSYADHFTLMLGGGVNEFEIHNARGHYQTWVINDSGLEATSGSLSVSSTSNISVSLWGTNEDDTFTVIDTPEEWSFNINARLGDDLLQMGLNHDLDDVFDYGLFEFFGGGGDDTVSLSDVHDEVGDFDRYEIGDRIAKGNSGAPARSYLDLAGVTHLIFEADNDPNNIVYDVGFFDVVEIYGANGHDTFVAQESSLIFCLAPVTRLFGDAGDDILSINDSTGIAADYEMNSGVFLYLPGTDTYRLEYTSFRTIDFLASSHSSEISVRSKPASSLFTLQDSGGDDTVTVGGGDIDNSGFSAATATLFGGTGNDHIVFDDSLDDHNVSDTDILTLNFQQVTKDGVAINYGGFESQKVITSGVNNAPVYFPNTVRINGIDMPTEIVGSAGDRDNIVHVGNATLGLSQLFGPISLDFTAAPVEVNVNDQTATADRLYNFSPSGLLSPIPIIYSGVAALNLFAGSGNDTLLVNAVPAGMFVSFKGNNGDEFVFLGNGSPLSDLAGRVVINGDGGFDSLFIQNGGSAFTQAQLTSSSFSANGGPLHLYGTMERVQLTLNDGGSYIDLLSTAAPTSIVGGSGDDHIVIGGGDLDAHITAPVHVGGGAGNDLLELDDSAGVPDASNNYLLSSDEGLDSLARSSGNLTSFGVEERILHGNDGNSLFRVFSSTSGLRLNANGGNDLMQISGSSQPVTVSSGSGVDFLELNPAATVAIDQDDELNSLIIPPSASLRVTDGAVLCNSPNPFSGNVELYIGGTMDLAGGAFLSRSGPMAPSQAEFRALLTAGRNGGAWNGANGAISSFTAATSPLADAVGYGLGSQIAPGSIGSFAINPADTLLRYTLEGDGDLNQVVNIADFARVAANFNGTNKLWTSADFNYDSAADIADFASVAANFNRTLGASRAITATTAPDLPASPFNNRLIEQLFRDAEGVG